MSQRALVVSALCAAALLGAVALLGSGEQSLADEAPAAVEWSWPKHLTAEQIGKLSVIRDRCRRELAALGPSPAERLRAIHVEPKQAAEIRAAVQDLSYTRRRGSAHLMRRNRRDRLIEANGILAVRYLCEVLGSDRYWSARVAAQALGILSSPAKSEDVRWLAFQFEAPKDLIAMFGSGPRSELRELHMELNATLGALIDEKLAERLDKVLSDESDSRAPATGKEAQAAWREAWSAARLRWRARESQRAKDRRELERKLDMLRRGLDPK
jgi:hypothetical protein